MAVELTSTLGDRFLKGIFARCLEYQNQANEAYSLVMPSALGVEKNTYTALFKDLTTENNQDVTISKTGLGYLTMTPEGEPFSVGTRSAGYSTVWTYPQFTKRIVVSRTNRADRLVDKQLEEARELLIAGMQTQNKHAFDNFNYMFTAQSSLPDHLSFYGDGVPGCSTIHPIKAPVGSTTTQSNASSTGAPFSPSALRAAMNTARNQVADNNQPQGYFGNDVILVVPDTLMEYAIEVTKSKQKSGTANNDLNVYYGGWMTVMSSRFLNAQNGGSDTAWFLVDSWRSPLRFITREALNVLHPYELTDGSHNVSIDLVGRWKTGLADFRGIWGSIGNSAVYSS